ncbi:hypothetical protein [Pseudomonas putida]|uniref:N-acetyltransferase domain-containing protein n=1 Tax=Pseudomonas putida TaxID=303 RepID=A0A8I1EA31_PSEPU|nr:hypothetical protein [Pseudomonas putida]MBI6882615.1 hypothetical protein [Pseudomonas putida]
MLAPAIELDFSPLNDFMVENSRGGIARKRFFIGPIDVYVRVNTRLLGHSSHRTLDLVDITIAEDQQGKGIFRSLLAYLEVAAAQNGRAIFVENIVNPILRSALARRGYSFRDGELGSGWKIFASLVA